MISATCNSKAFNQALDRLAIEVGKDIKDAVPYNAGQALKTIAYDTPKAPKVAARSDRPEETVKVKSAGRARAGWFKAWKALKLAGMAYSTAYAVKRFADKDGGFESRLDDSRPSVTIVNKVWYLRKIEGYDPVASVAAALEKQRGRMLKYIQSAIRRRKQQRLK